ncbi:ARL14 effector protein [Frankliniella fusca]|uniref:ARL14 effector protein n=1 Tax=Frankliniella fusca TaxID=407009 RepID=A0AAE1LSW4_9NEOP|nr:ARL14 effector protein [Frankliniella fusca]
MDNKANPNNSRACLVKRLKSPSIFAFGKIAEPSSKTAAICSLSSLDGKCDDVLLHRSSISVEDRRLVKLRTGGLKIKDSICSYHFKRFVHSYSSHEKYCCNFFNKHPKQTKVKATSDPISLALRGKGKAIGLSLIPGKKLCVTCRKHLFSLFRAEESEVTPLVSTTSSSPSVVLQSGAVDDARDSTSGDNAGGQPGNSDDNAPAVGSQESFTAPINKDTLQDINKFMIMHKKTPIDLKKLSQKGYTFQQIDALYRILLSLGKQPEPSVSITTAFENSSYFEEMVTQLQEYINQSSSDADNLHALSVLPRSMSVEKIREYFNVSKRLVKNTKSLVDRSGILCTPNKKLGRPKSEEILDAAKRFYLRQDISKELPGKNNFVTVRENGVRERRQVHLLMANIRHVHEEFLKNHPDMQLSLSKFASVRPKECYLASKSGMHNVCVCTIHENPKLMFKGARLNTISALKCNSVTDCIKYFVCGQPTTECYFRTCEKCPDKTLFSNIIQNHFDSEMVEEVTYNQWECTDRGNIITKISSIEDFVEDLVTLLEDLVTHHFIFKEQSSYFNERLNTLKDGEVVIVGDFAENYSFLVQNSIKAMYFNQKQSTIHPFSVTYWDPISAKKEQKCFAVISDYMDHSTVAFYAFQRKLLEELKKRNINMKMVYYFSDGCSGQYKNKKMAANVWYHEKDFGVPAQWHFFATSHGKSACDGIGGTLKRLASYYSKQHTEPGSQITTPRRLFEWAQENIKGICSLWVSTQEVAEVEKLLQVRFNSAYKIDGIKSSHSIIPCHGETSVLIKKYSHAQEGSKRKISTVEDKHLNIDEVRGFIIYHQEEPNWFLGYVNTVNKDAEEISIEQLKTKTGKKYEFIFEENQTKTILLDEILMLVNPQIMSRGKTIKILAAEANTADVLLKKVLNS